MPRMLNLSFREMLSIHSDGSDKEQLVACLLLSLKKCYLTQLDVFAPLFVS